MTQPIVFTEEQALVAASARDLLSAQVSFDHVRAQIDSEAGYDATLFREIAGLGWLGMAVPEAQGGAELGATELVAVLEEMGRAVYGSPFLATVLAAELLRCAGNEAQQERWLPGLAAGTAIGTIAVSEGQGSWDLAALDTTATRDGHSFVLRGEKSFVLDAQNANLLLVACRIGDGPGIAVVDAANLPDGALRPERLVDGSRRSARVRLDDVRVDADALLTGDEASSALRRVNLLGALLLAAEMSGTALGVFHLTLDYLKQRVQFGRKIGSYQALKHPMVEILLELEHARSLLYHAATLWDHHPDASDVEVAVRSAKLACGDSCSEAVDRAIQFHGAYGFTWECHAQLFFRRAQWAAYTFGDSAHHRRHLASLLLPK